LLKIINDIPQGDLILGSQGKIYGMHKPFRDSQEQLCDLACEQFLGEVMWNNGWDFGDNIFIFEDLLHRCLVQIKSAMGVPLSIQACCKRVTPEDMVVHSQDVTGNHGNT